MSSEKYLKDGRLPEVLALIQVLAFAKYTNRSEGGLSIALQASPTSSATWVILATEHPEFFRVRDDDEKTYLVSLISRFVLPKTIEDKHREPLSNTSVNKLMEVAIEIHDRQVERRDKWKLFIPIIVAVIAASAKIIFDNG